MQIVEHLINEIETIKSSIKNYAEENALLIEITENRSSYLQFEMFSNYVFGIQFERHASTGIAILETHEIRKGIKDDRLLVWHIPMNDLKLLVYDQSYSFDDHIQARSALYNSWKRNFSSFAEYYFSRLLEVIKRRERQFEIELDKRIKG